MPWYWVDDDVPDIVELLDRSSSARSGDLVRIERVDAFAQKADPADIVRLAPQGEDVAADVGVRVFESRPAPAGA